MTSKKAIVIIAVIVFTVLIAIGIMSYFSLFYISQAKAIKILSSDYSKNPDLVCKRFPVSDDKCLSFVSCYSSNSIMAMPKDLLVRFAKDVQSGKSRAIDSYPLVNGKNIGEECISQILNIPNNIEVNILSEKFSNIPEQIKNYLILDNLGTCKFDHSSNFTIKDHQLILATYKREGYNDANQECIFDLTIYNTPDQAKEEFDKIKSNGLAEASNPNNKLVSYKEKNVSGIYVLESKNYIYSPMQINNYWKKDNFVIKTRDLSIEGSIGTPVFDAYFNKFK